MRNFAKTNLLILSLSCLLASCGGGGSVVQSSQNVSSSKEESSESSLVTSEEISSSESVESSILSSEESEFETSEELESSEEELSSEVESSEQSSEEHLFNKYVGHRFINNKIEMGGAEITDNHTLIRYGLFNVYITIEAVNKATFHQIEYEYKFDVDENFRFSLISRYNQTVIGRAIPIDEESFNVAIMFGTYSCTLYFIKEDLNVERIELDPSKEVSFEVFKERVNQIESSWYTSIFYKYSELNFEYGQHYDYYLNEQGYGNVYTEWYPTIARPYIPEITRCDPSRISKELLPAFEEMGYFVIGEWKFYILNENLFGWVTGQDLQPDPVHPRYYTQLFNEEGFEVYSLQTNVLYDEDLYTDLIINYEYSSTHYFSEQVQNSSF